MPGIKGFLGEGVARLFMLGLAKNEYRVVNNITIRTPQGKTTQIDHIIVSLYGIFVIETKNYKGWIFGSEESQQWTQLLYKKKYQFYNPIKQNQGHIYALKNLLSDYSRLPFVSIVSFSPSATLKSITVSSEDTYVVYMHEVNRRIKSFSKVVMTPTDLDKIVARIQQHHLADPGIKAEHINNIKSFKNERKLSVKNGMCPKCNSSLVERTGPYGRFKGCSSFPRCTFKQSN